MHTACHSSELLRARTGHAVQGKPLHKAGIQPASSKVLFFFERLAKVLFFQKIELVAKVLKN